MALIDSADQAELRAAVRAFLTKHATSARVREAIASPDGFDRAVYRQLAAELGLTSLAVPEHYDGAGATLAEVAVVLEELGRVLLPSPYLSTALVAALLGEVGEQHPEVVTRFLGGLGTGDVVGAFAFEGAVTADVHDRLTGTVDFVLDGPHADLFLVAAGSSLFAVPAADITVIQVPTLDQTRAQARLVLDDAPAMRLSGADDGARVRRAQALLWVGLAVESSAAAGECLSRTVDYLSTRVQFGRPIGSFQALKHRCADLAVGVESARATAWAAVDAAMGRGSDRLDVLAPMAKLYCAGVLRRTAAEMIQLHGGIGFTWEHDAHLYFKRAKSTELLCGTPSVLRQLIGRRAGLLP